MKIKIQNQEKGAVGLFANYLWLIILLAVSLISIIFYGFAFLVMIMKGFLGGLAANIGVKFIFGRIKKKKRK